MKKTFIIASALVCLAACSKMETANPNNNTINPETHEITLTVSLEGDGEDTKTSYSDDGSALKCSWITGDKLTLVTYDATESSSTLKTIDNLTLSTVKDRTTATFTGTITGTPGAYYRVIYPAVTQTETSPYESLELGSGSIVSITQGSTYLEIKLSLFNRIMQTASGNRNHLRQCVLMGFGTITGDVLSPVSMANRFSILKITATLPETWAGKKLYAVIVKSDLCTCFMSEPTYGCTNSNSMAMVRGNNDRSGYSIGFGTFWDGNYTPSRFGGLEVKYITERKITVYYPYLPSISNDFKSGSTLSLNGYDSTDSYMLNGSGIEIARKTLTTTVDNAAGKVYTLNFD